MRSKKVVAAVLVCSIFDFITSRPCVRASAPSLVNKSSQCETAIIDSGVRCSPSSVTASLQASYIYETKANVDGASSACAIDQSIKQECR